jgi:hypothetical protein
MNTKQIVRLLATKTDFLQKAETAIRKILEAKQNQGNHDVSVFHEAPNATYWLGQARECAWSMKLILALVERNKRTDEAALAIRAFYDQYCTLSHYLFDVLCESEYTLKWVHYPTVRDLAPKEYWPNACLDYNWPKEIKPPVSLERPNPIGMLFRKYVVGDPTLQGASIPKLIEQGVR